VTASATHFLAVQFDGRPALYVLDLAHPSAPPVEVVAHPSSLEEVLPAGPRLIVGTDPVHAGDAAHWELREPGSTHGRVLPAGSGSPLATSPDLVVGAVGGYAKPQPIAIVHLSELVATRRIPPPPDGTIVVLGRTLLSVGMQPAEPKPGQTSRLALHRYDAASKKWRTTLGPESTFTTTAASTSQPPSCRSVSAMCWRLSRTGDSSGSTRRARSAISPGHLRYRTRRSTGSSD